MAAIRHECFHPPDDAAFLWDAWRAYLDPIFETEIRPETDLGGPIAMTHSHLGDLIIGEITAPAENLVRSASTAAQQGIDHVLLQFYRTGRSRVELAGGSCEMCPGQFILIDLAQPVRIVSAEPVSAATVMFPRSLISASIGAVEALHGTVSDFERDPAAWLFHTYLQGLFAVRTRLEDHHGSTVTQAASKLCRGFIRGRDAGGSTNGLKLGIAVRQFIHDRLASPDLGIDTITARFRLSRATLYRLFEEEGGVQNYIRTRRLTRAMKLITQPEHGSRPRISTVAFATGFADESTFSRAFKRQFGMSPRHAEALRIVGSAANDDDPVLMRWMRELTV